MDRRFCVSISEGSPIETIQLLKKYGFVELCLDKLNYSSFELASIIPFAERVILSCSTWNKAEFFSKILMSAKQGANIIDIPVQYVSSLTVNRIRASITGLMPRLIISYHNFDSFKSWKNELEVVINKMEKYSADYYKIAVVCDTRKEINYLFSFYKSLDAGIQNRLILVPMSTKFPESRVEAFKLGIPFMYCHAGKANAPGQMLYEDMVKAL